MSKGHQLALAPFHCVQVADFNLSKLVEEPPPETKDASIVAATASSSNAVLNPREWPCGQKDTLSCLAACGHQMCVCVCYVCVRACVSYSMPPPPSGWHQIWLHQIWVHT